MLAIAKPAGLPTMGVAHELPSLLTLAKQYIKRKYSKPGNVYLGTISRLDAPVTGVVIFARTSKAAARLSLQIRERQMRKTYWALVSGTPPETDGEWTDWLVKDERHRRMHTCQPHTPGAQLARLRWIRRESNGDTTFVEIELETGRKHQIRLQFSTRGFPIVGDRKYGSRVMFRAGIALHARQVRFCHPVRGDVIELTAPLPPAWTMFGITED